MLFGGSVDKSIIAILNRDIASIISEMVITTSGTDLCRVIEGFESHNNTRLYWLSDRRVDDFNIITDKPKSGYSINVKFIGKGYPSSLKMMFPKVTNRTLDEIAASADNDPTHLKMIDLGWRTCFD